MSLSKNQPQFKSVVASGSTTYATQMGSVYLFNEGPSDVNFSFDSGVNGAYVMLAREGVNLDNIIFLTLNYVFAGASTLRISALERGS